MLTILDCGGSLKMVGTSFLDDNVAGHFVILILISPGSNRYIHSLQVTENSEDPNRAIGNHALVHRTREKKKSCSKAKRIDFLKRHSGMFLYTEGIVIFSWQRDSVVSTCYHQSDRCNVSFFGESIQLQQRPLLWSVISGDIDVS